MRSTLFLLALLFAGNLPAANWPQFRGPAASGLDTNAPASQHWNLSKCENLLWRTAIPGLGHSSPILWDRWVYVTTAARTGEAELKVGLYGDIGSADDQSPHEWRLLALDAGNGKVIWNKLGCAAVPRAKRHPKSSHCSSTPATDGRRIVAIFGSEGLFCFDLEGRPVWKKDLGAMVSAYFRVPSAEWGFASSPVIHDGKVVVLCDVLTNSFLAVFNLTDGKEVWRVSRDDVPTWGTPAIAQTGKQTQILVNGWHHTGAYDFATGKGIWKLDGGGDIPVPTPILAAGCAVFTSAHGNWRPMRAIRLDAAGDITPSTIDGTNAGIAWVQPRQGNYMQTPIAVGDHVYGCTDYGVVTCFDSHSGKIAFSERIGNGSEGFTSSPVSDGRNLFFASEVGNVYVVPVAETFSVIATNKLEETCMATPALSGGVLFYRTRSNLVAIGERK
jgi:outer membrane protein assembly factor BamB